MLIFTISKLAPGNPIDNEIEKYANSGKWKDVEKTIQLKKREYGLDVPLFYFSFFRATTSEIIENISYPPLRKHILNISYQLANKESSIRYLDFLLNLRESNPEEFKNLIGLSDIEELSYALKQGGFNIQLQQKSTFFNFLPTVRWNGINNQYHHWIVNLIKGNFGKSYVDKGNVADKIKGSLSWTLSLSIISLIMSLAIAIPLALNSAKNPSSLFARITDVLLFAFFASPTFVFASLLILLFANPDFFNWFPSYGVGFASEGNTLVDTISIRIKHLTLPLICWTYGSIAFIYRQLKKSLELEMNKDYFLTAKSKGLSEKSIFKTQLLKNSLIPIITTIGLYFPIMISGSFVIEYVFSIPGMGSLTLDAFYQRDYPILFAVSMLASIATIIGVFFADIMYHLVDPRWQSE